MHFMSRVFSNITSLMTSVCMLYVGAMANTLYLSYYADKLLKGENQSSRRNTKGVREMLGELEWPSLEARRDRSSLDWFSPFSAY